MAPRPPSPCRCVWPAVSRTKHNFPGSSSVSRQSVVELLLGRFAARRVVALATCNALRCGPSLIPRVVFFPLQVLDLKKIDSTSRFRCEPDLQTTPR